MLINNKNLIKTIKRVDLTTEQETNLNEIPNIKNNLNDIKNTELENLNTAINTLETLVGLDETVGDKSGLPSGDANVIASINRIDRKTTTGNGLTTEQAQHLQTAYEHSQSDHVQASDIPTKTSELINNSNFVNSTDLGVAISSIASIPEGSLILREPIDGEIFSCEYNISSNSGSEDNPSKTLSSITATFNQGSTVVYPSTSLESLKNNLVVKANYSDSSQETVTAYTLSGTLSVGTSTITVTYSGKTTTFNVTVTEESTTTYTITNNLTNVINSNNSSSISSGSSYSATLTPSDGYEITSVTVTMFNNDVTSSVYSNGSINISSVTGNIVITATASSISSGDADYTNYCYNTETFTNPTSSSVPNKSSYYQTTGYTKSVNGGVMTLSLNTTNYGNALFAHRFAYSDDTNSVWYYKAKLKIGLSNARITLPGTSILNENITKNEWMDISVRFTNETTFSQLMMVGYVDNSNIGETIEFKEPMLLNLTEIYGSGNEPDKGTCDSTLIYVKGLEG